MKTEDSNWKKYVSSNPLIKDCRGCRYLVYDGIPNCGYYLTEGKRRPVIDGACGAKKEKQK